MVDDLVFSVGDQKRPQAGSDVEVSLDRVPLRPTGRSLTGSRFIHRVLEEQQQLHNRSDHQTLASQDMNLAPT